MKSLRGETAFLLLKDYEENNHEPVKTQAFCGGGRIILFCKLFYQ